MATNDTDSATESRITRLENYENRTSAIFFSLALVYIGIYTVQVLVPDLDFRGAVVLDVASYAIWISFAVDLAIRTYLAPQRLNYLLRHPIDVLAVIVPAFRVLRVLRVLTAAQWLLARGERLRIEKVGLVVVAAVSLLALLGALAVFDAERANPDANIVNMGDAFWWALVTMSTVGYGDYYPVTFTGKAVAVGLMVVGIGLLAGLAGMLSSGLIRKLTGAQDDQTQRILETLERLEAKVNTLESRAAERNIAAPGVDPQGG